MAMKGDDVPTDTSVSTRKLRARKNGASSISPDEVRAWADTVQLGECITFPNGLVVDKRWYPTQLNGWSCPTCGAWITGGTLHTCWKAY